MGALFALVTGMCWSAYNLSVRRGMQGLDGGTGYVITLLFGTAANCLWLLLPLPGRGAHMTSQLAVVWFILAGFSTTLLGRWVYFKAIRLLGPSRASAWKNASPLYTLFLGSIFLGERPGVMAVVGTGAVLSGLWLLSREQSRSVTPGTGSGAHGARAAITSAVALGIGAGMAISAGMLFRRAGLGLWPDAAAGNAIGGLAALAAYMPFALVKREAQQVFKATWREAWPWLLAGSFSAVAQVSTFLSLRVSMAVTTQVITAMEPMFTILLSAIFLGRAESLNVRLVGVAALICAGVVLMIL